MIRRSVCTCAVLALVALVGRSQGVLAITDVSVLAPEADQMRAGQTVLVRGDRIVEVGSSEEVDVPGKATVIDGQGRYLIPGLTDLHVHISRSSSDVAKLFDLFLDHGVTTILNLDGSRRVLAMRDQVAGGELVGPAIFSSGPILRGSEQMTREDGVKFATQHADLGYDMIKVYNGVTSEGYAGILEVANNRGLPVIGHAVRSIGLLKGLESGQHIAHMEEVVYGYFTWRGREREALPEDPTERRSVLLNVAEIDDLARRVAESGVSVIPNLVVYKQIAGQLLDPETFLSRPEAERMPESMVRSWQADRNGYFKRSNPESFLESLQQTYPFLEKLTKAFSDAGVPMLAGTDVGVPMVIAGVSLHEELELLVVAGLSPAAALATATIAAAEFLKRDDAGQVRPGFRADLILLRANPLEDIRNTRTIDAVLLAGRELGSEAAGS